MVYVFGNVYTPTVVCVYGDIANDHIQTIPSSNGVLGNSKECPFTSLKPRFMTGGDLSFKVDSHGYIVQSHDVLNNG